MLLLALTVSVAGAEGSYGENGHAVAQEFAVVGATGRQGGAVARELLRRGYRVRALTRSPDSAPARALAALGAHVVRADLSNRASVEAAFRGAYGVFSMTDFWEHGYDGEVLHGRHIVEAARATGVRHLVYSSVASAHLRTGVPHFESKYEVEELIRRSGVPHTILRPVSFMETAVSADDLAAGVLIDPRAPEARHQYISVRDIARFVAEAFENPQAWLGRALDIAGDELTVAQTAAVMARALGRPVQHRRASWSTIEREAGAEMAQMLRWFERVGYSADVAALRRDYPWLLRLEQHLAESLLEAGPVPDPRPAEPRQEPRDSDDLPDLLASMTRAVGGERAVAVRTLIVEWRGDVHYVGQSRRVEPPWDIGLSWRGRAVDFAHQRQLGRDFEQGSGYLRVSGAEARGEKPGVVWNVIGRTVQESAGATFAGAIDELIPYSPLLAVRVLRDDPSRASVSRDVACAGRVVRTIEVKRARGGNVMLMIDPESGEIRCTQYSFDDFNGRPVAVRIEHEGQASFGALRHPSAYRERVRGEVTQRVSLTRLQADFDLTSAPGAPADWTLLAPEPPGSRDFRAAAIAPGLWLVGEGVMYQLFVEFDDFVVALDGSTGDVARRLAAVREKIPDKPVRYVLASHHHDDHLDGLDDYARLGASVLAARAHVAAVRTFLGEDLAQRIQPVDERFAIESGGRRLEILDIGPLPHSEHMLAAWLPNERILFEADLMVLRRLDPVAPASPNMVGLLDAIRRLRLPAERFVEPHSPVIATRAYLERAVERAAELRGTSIPTDGLWLTDPGQ